MRQYDNYVQQTEVLTEYMCGSLFGGKCCVVIIKSTAPFVYKMVVKYCILFLSYKSNSSLENIFRLENSTCTPKFTLV